MRINPLPAPLGAQVTGVDLTHPLDGKTAAGLRQAWLDHLVLIFPDQDISDPELLRFTREFGELDPPGPNPYGAPFLKEFPEINVISNVMEKGVPIGNLGAGEAVWHADMTYIDTPPNGAILHALEIPPDGGDTYFANMYEAYETLPADLKLRIEGKSAIHDATFNSAGMMRKGYKDVTDPREAPGAHHPLVRVHPETGRQCLFLGRRRNSYILGLSLEESEALLDQLWEHATQQDFWMSHQWRVHDVLMWDNRCTLHRRDPFDPDTRRIMHRTQIKGGPVESRARPAA